MRIAVFYLVLTFFASCSTNKSDDILKPEKMQAVFWDIIRADVLTTDYTGGDSSKKPMIENIALQKKIFQIHGITKEQYDKSFDYYTEHPAIMTVILDSMLAKESRNKVKPQIKPVIKDL